MIIVLSDRTKWCICFLKIKNNSYEKDVIDTKCDLSEFGGHIGVCVGWALQNPSDRYDKLTGKKLALTRALKASEYFTAPERFGGTTLLSNCKDPKFKARRYEVWEAFWKEFKHLRV